MKGKFVILLFVFFQVPSLRAQLALQDSVYHLCLDMMQAKGEVKKNECSEKFSSALKFALSGDKKAELPFDSLKRYKMVIQSPDKQVRIFTWDIEADDRTHTYYGFIHAYNRKSKQFEVYELKDKSDGMKDPENASLDNTKWYGAYYYQIAEYKHKKKKYYLLLGWNGNNGISNKRVIEALYFTDKGLPKFGEPVFPKENGKIVRRVIFEFKAGIFTTLRYDEEKEVILFDHLSPSDPGLEGVYSFYGPDFSYDMLELRKGRWLYFKNVDVRNPKNRTDKHFNTPK